MKVLSNCTYKLLMAMAIMPVLSLNVYAQENPRIGIKIQGTLPTESAPAESQESAISVARKALPKIAEGKLQLLEPPSRKEFAPPAFRRERGQFSSQEIMSRIYEVEKNQIRYEWQMVDIVNQLNRELNMVYQYIEDIQHLPEPEPVNMTPFKIVTGYDCSAVSRNASGSGSGNTQPKAKSAAISSCIEKSVSAASSSFWRDEYTKECAKSVECSEAVKWYLPNGRPL